MSGKILVVDDEADIVKVLSTRLKERGYEIYTALSAQEAIQQINRKMPDLIILDIMMPGMSGADLADQLTHDEKTKKIPIIFLSAILSKKEEKEYGNIIGGNTVLAKPYNLDFLIAKIEERLQSLQA